MTKEEALEELKFQGSNRMERGGMMTNEEILKTIEGVLEELRSAGWEDLSKEYDEEWLYKCAELVKKDEQFRWHDLRKDPNDLPEHRRNLCIVAFECSIGMLGHELQFVEYFNGKFENVQDNVIAWKYAEGFYEEDE